MKLRGLQARLCQAIAGRSVACCFSIFEVWTQFCKCDSICNGPSFATMCCSVVIEIMERAGVR